MRSRLLQMAGVVFVVLAVAQFVRPNFTNPEAKLSARDVAMICAAAEQIDHNRQQPMSRR